MYESIALLTYRVIAAGNAAALSSVPAKGSQDGTRPRMLPLKRAHPATQGTVSTAARISGAWRASHIIVGVIPASARMQGSADVRSRRVASKTPSGAPAQLLPVRARCVTGAPV